MHCFFAFFLRSFFLRRCRRLATTPGTAGTEDNSYDGSEKRQKKSRGLSLVELKLTSSLVAFSGCRNLPEQQKKGPLDTATTVSELCLAGLGSR